LGTGLEPLGVRVVAGIVWIILNMDNGSVAKAWRDWWKVLLSFSSSWMSGEDDMLWLSREEGE